MTIETCKTDSREELLLRRWFLFQRLGYMTHLEFGLSYYQPMVHML